MDDKDTVYKVVISIPSEGHTLPESYDNHMLLAMSIGRMEMRQKYEKRSPRYEFYWHTAGRLLTAAAREKLAEKALEGGMDYMIMFDDDMVLPLDFVEAMLHDMEEHPEIGVLGALAFMRNPPHYPVMYTTTEGWDNVRNKTYFANEFVKKYPRDQLVECDAVGFGGVCIRMDVLRKMNSPYFFSTTGSGEDIFFCFNAKKQTGTRIFMDTRIKLGHLMNPKIADEEYFDEYNKKNKIKFPDVPHKYTQYE